MQGSWRHSTRGLQLGLGLCPPRHVDKGLGGPATLSPAAQPPLPARGWGDTAPNLRGFRRSLPPSSSGTLQTPSSLPSSGARQPWGSASGSMKHQDRSSEAKSHQGRWAGIRTSSGRGGRDEGRRGHSHAPEAEDSQGFQLGNFKNVLRQDNLEKPGHHLFLTASGL